LSEHLHFERDGDESKPALLLLHGFLSSNLQWAPNRERLSQCFQLIAVELWGHGATPAPPDPARYRVASYVDELERIRATLGIERWLVCGQSFGAGIAIQYALACAGAVSGLAIANSRSALNTVGDAGRESSSLEAWERTDPRSLPFHPCHAKRFPARLKARMERAADAVPAMAIWQATATTAPELSCRGLVEKLQTPTLLLNGRFEKSFQADRDFAAAKIPGIEIVDLDAGHSVNIEAAADFDAALIAFGARSC